MQNKNIAKIGNYSNDNVVIQGVEYNNNIYVAENSLCASAKVLADFGHYDSINAIFQKSMQEISQLHPLKPWYGTKVVQMGMLQKLVSTPLLDDANKLFPKNIKSTVQFCPSDYPGYNTKESPWEYAYRTQREVVLDTKTYKEYLGEYEDPFPVTDYKDGMKLKILPPEFPDASEVVLRAGLTSYSTKLRRVACDDYGIIKLTNECDASSPLGVIFILDENNKKTRVSMKRNKTTSLEKLIIIEQLVKSILENQLLAVTMNDRPLMMLEKIDLKELEQDFFKLAETNLKLYSSLKFIEGYFGIRFDLSQEITDQDYYYAVLLSASLKRRWQFIKNESKFRVSTESDKIEIDFDEEIEENTPYIYQRFDCQWNILGIGFKADSLFTSIHNSKIVNIKTVNKKIKEKQERVDIIFAPIKGKRIGIYSYIDNPQLIDKGN